MLRGEPRDGLASPSGGSRITLSGFMLLKPEIAVFAYLLMLFEIVNESTELESSFKNRCVKELHAKGK